MSALPPKADNQQIVPRCPLSAISGPVRCGKDACVLDSGHTGGAVLPPGGSLDDPIESIVQMGRE